LTISSSGKNQENGVVKKVYRAHSSDLSL
jgi:hypothetical protein